MNTTTILANRLRAGHYIWISDNANAKVTSVTKRTDLLAVAASTEFEGRPSTTELFSWNEEVTILA